ncbi:MAG: polysaccharide deacetylase family protein [Clostridia bacterium]
MKRLLIISFLFMFLAPHMAVAEAKEVDVPILMYHNIVANKPNFNDLLASDMEKDLIYLKQKGYTTVNMRQLINYVYNGVALPKKPIVLTFDDGFYSMKSMLLPLLKKHNCVAVVSVVGDFVKFDVNNINVAERYAYLTYKEMQVLQDSGYIEIQNHTNSLHYSKFGRSGCKIKKNEPVESYKKFLENDLQTLNNNLNKVGIKPTTFTYPYGAYSKESEEVVKKMKFYSTLSCEYGTNKITRNKECLYLLKRYNRYGTLSNLSKLV